MILKEQTYQRVFAFLFGSYLLFLSPFRVFPLVYTPGWSLTQGMILQSYTLEGKLFHKNVFEYQYSFNGVTYSGSNRKWPNLVHYETDKHIAKFYMKKYAQGKSVDVYVNPKQPKYSLLGI